MQAIASRSALAQTASESEARPSDRILYLVGPVVFLLLVSAARLVEWRLFGGELFPASPHLPMAAFVSQLGAFAADFWLAVPIACLMAVALRRRPAEPVREAA